MKRLLALLLSMMMIVSLVGCGSKEEVKPVGEDTTATVTEAETETEAEGMTDVKPSGTITVWGWDYIKTNIDLLIEDFNKAYPDIEVIVEVPGGTADVYQKYLLALSSGEGIPDVVALETSHVAQYIETGGILDITDRVAPYKDLIVEAKWPALTKDNKVYGMPWDSGPVGIYYRRDVFEAAGYDSSPEAVAELLKTWDDYLEVAKVIKEKTGSYMFSESIEKPTGRTYEIMLWQQGQLYFDEGGQPIINNDTAIKTLDFLGEFVKNDLVDNSEEWTQPWYDSMASGNVATAINAVWMGGFLSGWIAPDAIGMWGVVPMPVWQEGGSRTANSGGSNFVISKDTENPEAAWAFTEFYLGRAESNLAMYQGTDAFPSLKSIYSDPFFEEAIDYYAGQAIRKVFAELVSEIPPVEYTANFPVANEAVRDAIQRYFLLGETSQEALSQAQATVTESVQ
jgi:lactose/L-arabinose transport system substrate-binding protein